MRRHLRVWGGAGAGGGGALQALLPGPGLQAFARPLLPPPPTPYPHAPPAHERSTRWLGCGGAASAETADIDRRVGLSAAAYHHEYFLRGRPVLIRNALSAAERCQLAATRPTIAAASRRRLRCGATAYPPLTGRKPCPGSFSLLELRSSPRCNDSLRTRPLCTWAKHLAARAHPSSCPVLAPLPSSPTPGLGAPLCVRAACG